LFQFLHRAKIRKKTSASALTLTATFEPELVPSPAGEVRIVMSTGTIAWAASNLSGYQTFAPNATDYGALFQWGYDTAQPTSGAPINWQTTAYSGADWNGGRGPCPTGWRMPTQAECQDLISTTYTTVSSTSGASGGSVITPKAGDTTKTLRLPNAGVRYTDGTAAAQGATAEYWTSSSIDGTNAHHLHNISSVQADPKLYAWPVRCVRTVE
jgi:uncharacterized protein (TIGR02145 family)